MTVNNEVKVKIDYQKSSVEFSGDPTKVLILINDFFIAWAKSYQLHLPPADR